MKIFGSPLHTRMLIIGALALVPAVTLTTSIAEATPPVKSVTHRCVGATPLGPQSGTIEARVRTIAPASVEMDDNFNIVLSPLYLTVPTQIEGRKVVDVRNADALIMYPTNATFRKAFLTDGSGVSGVALTPEADGLHLTVPGPIPGGAKYRLPSITIEVTADQGEEGDIIKTILGGTSFNRPGLTFTAMIRGKSGKVFTVPVACFPHPNQTLTSTVIGEDDNNSESGQPGTNQGASDQPEINQDESPFLVRP